MDPKPYRGSAISIIILCCLFLIFLLFVLGNGNGNGNGNQQQQIHDNDKEKTSSVSEMLLSRVCHVLSASFPAAPILITTNGGYYWDEAKTLINRLLAHFFSPNLDFRGGGREEVEVASINEGGGGGAAMGGKVKEAVSKSFGKSKATVEDSAKTAAKLAGETVHKTAEKLKRTFSDESDHLHDDQSEL